MTGSMDLSKSINWWVSPLIVFISPRHGRPSILSFTSPFSLPTPLLPSALNVLLLRLLLRLLTARPNTRSTTLSIPAFTVVNFNISSTGLVTARRIAPGSPLLNSFRMPLWLSLSSTIITLLPPAVSLPVHFNSSRCLPPWSPSLPPTLFASIGSLVFTTALARTRWGVLDRVDAILEERERLRAIPFRVMFFFFFLSLSHSLSPPLLRISPIRITTMPSPGHIYYRPTAMKTDSLSSGKPMDNPHALCLMLFIPL